MTQLPLEWNRDNAPELDRVGGRIAGTVLQFCRWRIIGAPHEFRMAELQGYVLQHTGVAPDSPGRILRDLRQRGLIDYRVVNRRASLYQLLGVQENLPVVAA